MCAIYGKPELPEQELKHWEGYKKSSPVRIGNDAYKQFQSDVYGELMDSLYLYNKYALPISYDFWTAIRHRLDWVFGKRKKPEQGILGVGKRQGNFLDLKVVN